MPTQSQVDYWENEWDIRDLDKQIESGKKKAWWPVLEEILNKEVAEDDLIVEAGCGMGQFVHLMDGMGKKVLGVDVTQKAVDRTLEHYPHLDLQVQDIRDFKLDTDSVKLMLSLGVVEHFIEGPQDPLREASRVIKPGGILFITIPFTNYYRRLREPWWRFKHFFTTKRWFQKLTGSRELEFYQYTYAEHHVERFLADHGFAIERVLLHHSHVTAQKDFKKSWWFKIWARASYKRLLTKKLAAKKKENLKLRVDKALAAEEERAGGDLPTNKQIKAWSAEQEAANPARFAHIALYVARRV